ncbi:hypothetical protein EVAR_46992_1 [Eumeta japonica]|uniref:Uncharacterized protein n=1 Tax=Eumeta variegata TaxID=151549 RepID=A0A4C1X996_EUMVA|nr:hypothetical protein EVAR_46992_1 [Eumeta japonica]
MGAIDQSVKLPGVALINQSTGVSTKIYPHPAFKLYLVLRHLHRSRKSAVRDCRGAESTKFRESLTAPIENELDSFVPWMSTKTENSKSQSTLKAGVATLDASDGSSYAIDKLSAAKPAHCRRKGLKKIADRLNRSSWLGFYASTAGIRFIAATLTNASFEILRSDRIETFQGKRPSTQSQTRERPKELLKGYNWSGRSDYYVKFLIEGIGSFKASILPQCGSGPLTSVVGDVITLSGTDALSEARRVCRTVQHTKLCRSVLPANDALRRYVQRSPALHPSALPRSHFTQLRRFRITQRQSSVRCTVNDFKLKTLL